MPRKAKKGAVKHKTRRITFNVIIEATIAEHKIPLMLSEFPDLLDELRSEDTDRQILSVWGVIHDFQDPVAEYEYIQSADGKDCDIREVRLADQQYLGSLGYKV
jgi:hypothetical protein